MDRNEKGELIIVDYKSGKAPMAKYKEPRFFALKVIRFIDKGRAWRNPCRIEINISQKLHYSYIKN